ncbi:MAG: alpha-L-arabinofuranosidase, partial [Muribaculaceae bacterium]|nr:alpha-L-arabinofuranosidase [Muribaculaceae bacterium]
MINNFCKIGAVSIMMLTASFNVSGAPTQSDSENVDLFCYSKSDGRSGLRLAWSENGKDWSSICSPKSESKSGWNFVNSDFGPWGSHKTMFDPRIYKTDNGWMAVWYVSDKYETLACAETNNFINWSPQRYVEKADSCKLGYCSLKRGVAVKGNVAGREFNGEVIRVPRKIIDNLLDYMNKRAEKQEIESARMKDDAERFKSLKSLKGSLGLNPYAYRRISDKLIGIFFEDINYSADGGLYGELVQNRDFEYNYEENHKDGWGPAYSWKLTDKAGNAQDMQFDTADPIHANNSTYLKVNAQNNAYVLTNEGFDGISLSKGENYRFSMFVRNCGKGKKSSFNVKLCDANGATVAQASVEVKGNKWQKINKVLTAGSEVKGGKLVIDINKGDVCDLDMISLFPENTYNGRENGLRKDLATVLADLKPRFIRFPGGCLAHGDGIDNIYDWKGSIGPLETRKPLRNIWNYHQTRGLGYHEYFLMCEDFGAEPLPVLAAGVPCQNSGRKHAHSHNEITTMGQQCGI